MSVGYDHVDVEAVKKRSVQLGYTPDVLTDATADLTALLTLAAARRMKEASDHFSRLNSSIDRDRSNIIHLQSIDAVRNGEVSVQRIQPYRSQL